MEPYSDDPERHQPQDALPAASSPSTATTNHDDSGLLGSWKRKGRNHPVIFVLICALASFFINFAAFINLAPQLRIFEIIICRNHYDKHDPNLFPYPEEIPEARCKISPVQSEIALVQALIASFDAIPGMCFLLCPLWPCLLYGYLTRSNSLGNLIERLTLVYPISLCLIRYFSAASIWPVSG